MVFSATSRLGFRRRTVLLVEDSPADVRLVCEAFSEALIPVELYVARDGDRALQFLRREGKYAGMPQPDSVLFDLNLPGTDGRDALRTVKGDAQLAHLPIVVLTSSIAQSDVDAAYRLSANCYLSKPVDLDEYLSLMRLFEQFWLETACLPDGH
jgi:two-component system, chemotaxis family, response regulator Rcp1